MDFLIDIGITLALDIIVFVCLLLIVAYSTWFERKLLGDFQLRYGPMRTGFHGLMQPIADAINKSVESFDQKDKKSRVLILITDGEDHEVYSCLAHYKTGRLIRFALNTNSRQVILL